MPLRQPLLRPGPLRRGERIAREKELIDEHGIGGRRTPDGIGLDRFEHLGHRERHAPAQRTANRQRPAWCGLRLRLNRPPNSFTIAFRKGRERQLDPRLVGQLEDRHGGIARLEPDELGSQGPRVIRGPAGRSPAEQHNRSDKFDEAMHRSRASLGAPVRVRTSLRIPRAHEKTRRGSVEPRRVT